MTELGDVLGRLTNGVIVLPDGPKPSCGCDWVPLDQDMEPGRVYCDGRWHHRAEGNLGRCPALVKLEIKARVVTERARLSGALARLALHGGASFDGYDTTRGDGLDKALEVMRRFSGARPPCTGVLLSGPAGLGKTRLLLASHFTLLEAGISSQYVTSAELRRLFRASDNLNEEVREEAKHALDRYLYAQAVHADDLGEIEDDQRARGRFAEGLKELLDRSRGAWAIATNRSGEEAERHPDLTGTVVSRMVLDADVVKMVGKDFRNGTARR